MKLPETSELKKKLCQEIDTFLANGLPTYETVLKTMPYLRAVIDETLRLHPPVSWDPKTALKDDVLPGGYLVKAGTLIAWNAFTMGRRKDYWDNPNEFRPERFLGENGGIEVKPYQFIPFQAGPRICLGQQMAYLEISVVVCLLLKKYHFELERNKPAEYFIGITLAIKDGLRINASFR